MSLPLTGIYEIDLSILLEIPDKSLPSICRSSTYINNICKDEYFWRQKLVRKGYQDLFPNLGLTNRNLYMHMKINGGGYLVIGGGGFISLYNNIYDAYQEFIIMIMERVVRYTVERFLFPPLEKIHEFGNFINRHNLQMSPNTFIEIYRLPGGSEVHLGDLNYLMLSLHTYSTYNVGRYIGGNNMMYISPEIHQSPLIGQPSDKYIYYQGDSKNPDEEENTPEDRFVGIEKLIPGKLYNYSRKSPGNNSNRNGSAYIRIS